MHKPPSDHDEWLEENQDSEKHPDLTPQKQPRRPLPNKPSGAERRFKALNDDIQEYG